MSRLTPFLVLLLALIIAPLGAPHRAPGAFAAQSGPPTLSQAPILPDYVERESQGGAANGAVTSAETIGEGELFSWSQTITGTIGSSADVDYFSFSLSQPASTITITLAGPPADYDLVLGGGVDPSQTSGVGDTFQSGLEQITQVGGSINSIGGSINSIGGSINSIGGSINSIGGSINSIGGSINSIGGSINSISANADTASEAIGTQLWLPGRYFVVVTTSNGEFSTDQPYTLRVELSESGLFEPPPAPEVDVRLDAFPSAAEITTLYIHYPGRLDQLYGPGGDISRITGSLFDLASSPPAPNGASPEYGVVIDLGALQRIDGSGTITEVYGLWEANQSNPLYANYVAGLIDNVIESTVSGQPSGPEPAFELVLGSEPDPAPLPNVRNIVLIGGDEIIPFYRVPDLTTIANEADYAAYLAQIDPGGIIGADTPQGAALRYRMLLTDGPYGSGRPYRFYGFPFFLPRLAVGRLVETPAEIADFLEAGRFAEAEFTIDATSSGQPGGPRRAFVSGYDFLKDQAAAVGATLLDAGLQPNEFNVLVDDVWGRPELERAWFDGVLDRDLPVPPGFISGEANTALSSVNAHFDHWQLLPANNPTGDNGATFPARRLLEPQYVAPGEQPLYFAGTLGYSVGCHSGYNVIAASVGAVRQNGLAQTDPELYRADFPQAFNRHGGHWVGNTGYGYGTADGVDYSERLAVLYTQELARETFDSAGAIQIGASIGEALVKARQRYVRNAASLTAYDYKVINIMTLYGLPFVRVNVSDPLAPPPEDPGPNRPNVPLEIPAPAEPNNETGRLTRTITFTIDVDPSDFKDVPRTGSTLFELDPADFDVEDSFAQLGDFPTQPVRIFNNNQAGLPALPTFAYDISTRNRADSGRLKVLDLVFVSGTYSNRPAFDPQVTQVATETLETTPIVSRTDEPSFAAGANVWYPDKFFGFSTVGEGEQQRDQLTAFAAQFRADPNGVTGLLRPYRQMVFQITYDDPSVSNPTADALDRDNQPPLITSVRIQATGTGSNLLQVPRSVIVVEASDQGPDVDNDGTNQGLADVNAVFVQNGESWVPVSLSEAPQGSGIFISEPLPLRPGEVRFIVRATDRAGNTTYYTVKGRFTPIREGFLPLVWR